MIHMEYGYLVINILILFAFFIGHSKWTMDLINGQADLIDKILNHLKLNQDESLPESQTSLEDYKTHILGGIVDMGTHNEGVCSQDCWCHEEEE